MSTGEVLQRRRKYASCVFYESRIKRHFQICIGRVSDNLICKKKPYRVKNSAAFILNREKTNMEYILDVDSDLGLKMTKSENVRFYELSYGKDDSIQLSRVVTVEKSDRGQVICGTYKERNGSNWEVWEADLNKLVAVII